MRILIMWRQGSIKCRNTIVDHALSFKRYDKENEYFYFDVWNGRYATDYEWITKDMFDVVIFHYSLLALRTVERFWKDFVILMQNVWMNYSCVRVLLPQDDYTMTGELWDFCNAIKADFIFTIMREQDFEKVYPVEKIGKTIKKNVLTGYVDDQYINKIKLLPHSERLFDVVYRARKLAYEFGKHGQLKWELVNIFKNILEKQNQRINIANTESDKGAILGDDWLYFIASARVTFGCLGGAGIMDIDGSIRNKVREFVNSHNSATYEETKQACFPFLDDYLRGMLSPRIFECALTKTCQVLVGKDYHDILIPDVDYIVLNEDYSNIVEVVEKIKDIIYCESIAEVCYRDIVESGKYSYKQFVNFILQEIGDSVKCKPVDMEISERISCHCKKNNNKVLLEMKKYNM